MSCCLPGSADTVAPIIRARLARDGAQAAVEIDGCNLSIRYAQQDHGQVKSAVLLEFGARATGEPADFHDIACDSAAAGLDIDLPTARARVMKAERTFWEKATAVHVFCRSGDPVGDHKARHWYDLERLDANGVAARAIADAGLAAQVATHKNAFFRERDQAGAWIDYHAAVGGGLQLVPVGPHLAELEADYAAMQADGLLPEGALTFARLMARCGEIERAGQRGEISGGLGGGRLPTLGRCACGRRTAAAGTSTADVGERLAVTLGPAAVARLLRARPCGRFAPPATRRRFPPCSTG
jgi:hypothetical protein